MNDAMQVYLSAWPTVWAMDTARYLVGATLMATILALFWKAGLARRKLQARDATGADKRREVLAYYKIPQELLANVSTWGMGAIGVGFFIAFVFLVVGCFLDAIPAIIIVGTVLEPLAKSVEMHPVHFAIVSIVSLAFGLVTPPYGLCLMISCAVAGVPLRFALKDTMIMLVPMILVLAAMIVWPEIPLFLPRLIAPELLK